MEDQTLYNGVPLANSELLARLRNNPRPWFADLSHAELCTQIDAMIDATRSHGRAAELDDDEPVEVVPVPPRRQRKRSLTKVCEAARKAGADRVIVDGVVIALSPVAAAPESTANEWDVVLSEDDHGAR